MDEQIAASIGIGLFALLVVWVAAEKPNSGHARAVSALIDRLLAVESGDLSSPAPPILRSEMPRLAMAVDGLFEQVRSNIDQVQRIAMFDPVTQLPNRLHFKREADRILKLQAGEPAALLFIDLDRFKEVNDTLGHAHGDEVLIRVAERLREVVGELAASENHWQPLLARLAGDEFTMLLPAKSQAQADEAARKVRDRLSERFEHMGQKITMGASVGIALHPVHGIELTDLMKAADMAMYHAKALGGGEVFTFNADLAAAFEQKSRTERALREAVAQGQFNLVYQPQICARTGGVVAVEALLRWNHPTDGVRMPDSFIPVAEDTKLIVAVGEWVVEAAMDTVKAWQADGLDHRLTINVSPSQIERSDFFEHFRECLDRSGVPPHMLELELTETMVLQCDDLIVAELNALRALGVAITLDDFGAGYSNLSRMKDVPLDRVKLDRSLIHDVDTSENARTIVSAIIHLCHGLGCEVVAEGVERREQLAVLRMIGCDTIQGYAFAYPMPEAEMRAWVGQPRHERLALIA
ncbi:putative bifunctional diguanylate cyclase/phosphodiesterase [Allosphingosinicella vermicomposti]|uniref:putative bifunctional diguanylate cyclase/phosphodiesterase n=1 Tax=Allosphingosinicella vermicomposti TaxID=614671 RepID=UPI001FE1D51D|nr:bifunctional diguanylate cyclase/phosphodiesterase [Allosphingosinicella vermicomposti]